MFLENTYLDHAQNKSKKKQSYAEYHYPECFYCLDYTDDGFAYISAWNLGSNSMNMEF